MYGLIRQIIYQHESPPYACTLNGHVLDAICQIAYTRTLELTMKIFKPLYYFVQTFKSHISVEIFLQMIRVLVGKPRYRWCSID